MNIEKIKIAVINDELLVLDTIEKFLKKYLGCEADSYINPLSAVPCIHTIEYDLIILDSSMPVLNGSQILESIMKVKSNQKIIFTDPGNILKENIKSYNQDQIDFILKPMESLDLLKVKIDCLLSKVM